MNIQNLKDEEKPSWKKKYNEKNKQFSKENKDISTRTPPRITMCSGRLSTSWSTSCNSYVVNCMYTIGDSTIMEERTGSLLQQLEQQMIAPVNIRRKKRKTIILAIGTIGHIAFFWSVPSIKNIMIGYESFEITYQRGDV